MLLLVYVMRVKQMILAVCGRVEHPFDPDGEGGDARGGVRLRSKWKGHGA